MISEVAIEEFLVHKHKKFQLNARGVTLICGANGVGKTALVQSVIWALWGKKLRTLTEHSSVRLKTGKGALYRRTKPSELVDYGGTKNSNKTRIASQIEADWGTYDAWVRTLYITGKTVGKFTSSSPSEKWQHLEQVIDAVLFRKVVENLSNQLQVLTIQSTQKAQAGQPLNWAASRAYQAFSDRQRRHRVLPGGPNVPAAEATVRLCQQHVEQHAALVKATTSELYAAGKLLEDFQNSRALEEAQTAYRNCPEADTCFVCGQPKPHPVREQLRATLTTVTKERDALQDQIATLQRRLHLDRNAKSIADSELQTAVAKYEVAQTSEYALEQHEESLYMDAAAYIEAAERLTEHDKEAAELSDTLGVLKLAKQAVERARVQYMLDYAVRIGSLANQYLQLIGAKHSIEMVLEKGKLEIQVSGTGAESYADCSSGEQRRIDICLLLAMSQVAANSGNITACTPMIIDEALDTLDSDGVDALLLLACQIGQTRQVILVSHAAHPLPQGSEIQTLQL